MDLARHQRKILRLIKSTYDGSDDDDPYIRSLAGSKNLELVREISTWWRMVGIQQSCTLTPRLLKELGTFEPTVQEFVRDWKISPFVEHLADAFLEAMGRHRDPLVASVARFELALIRVKKGDSSEYLIDWERDPRPVLASLLGNGSLDKDGEPARYRTVVSREIPELFRVVR